MSSPSLDFLTTEGLTHRADDCRHDDPVTRELVPDPALYPFQHRHAELGDAAVHYVDEGEGPAIVFLHAAPLWSFGFRNLILALRDRYRCIALDFPGWGFSKSTAPTLTSFELSSLVGRFVHALDLRDLTIFAHLTAGPVAVHAAGAMSQRMRALVLADTFAWPLRHPVARVIFAFFASAPFRFAVERTNIMAKVNSEIAPRGRKLSAAERAAYYRAFADRRARGRIVDMLADLYRTPRFLEEAEQALGTLRSLPALLIYGEHSPVRRVGFQRHFERVLTDHRSVVVSKEGPVSIEGSPDIVIAAVSDFMRSLATREQKNDPLLTP